MRVRRVRVVLGTMLGLVVVVGWAFGARAQTTTAPTTNTTARVTTTTHLGTTTTRPGASSTTSTTRRPAPVQRLAFQANPTEGPPGTSITVQSINECKGVGNFYVLLSIGSFRLGSGPANNVGAWKFSVTVPQIPAGSYGLAATCLISRNGVDENAGIYTGPEFSVAASSGQAPTEPTTPAANKSSGSDNTGLLIGLIAASVIAVAAIIWALALRSRHRKATAAAGGVGRPQPPA
jgi:hypothetical protein